MRTVMKTIARVSLPGLLVGLGCGAMPPEPAGQQRAAVDEDRGADLSARPPDRGKARGGERMRRTVRWPDAEARDGAAYEGFDARSRVAIDEAPVPVLVPAPAVALDERSVMRGPEWYAFWGRRAAGDAEAAVTITLQASRMARVYPGVRPQAGQHTLRGLPAFVTQNEGIWSASWIEHGVAYDLGLECAPPDAAPCHDQAELEALAEGLRYVGGQGLPKEVAP